ETIEQLGQRIRAAHEARKQTPWVRPAPLRVALTALALSLESNPFRLPANSTLTAKLAPAVLKSDRPSFGDRVRGFFRNITVKAAAQLRPLDPQSAVHIAPVADYNADLADVVKRQYESFRERVPLKGKRVVLKPNLVEYHRDKVINTNPNVVAAVI